MQSCKLKGGKKLALFCIHAYGMVHNVVPSEASVRIIPGNTQDQIP